MQRRSSRKQKHSFSWLAILAVGVVLLGFLIWRSKETAPAPSTSTSSTSQIQTPGEAGGSAEELPTVSPGNELPSSDVSTPAVATEMEIDSVLAGDLTSLAGTWVDGNGRSLVFDENGLSAENGMLAEFTTYAEGVVKAYITFPDEFGATIYFIQKGVEFPVTAAPEETVNYIDASDHSLDRILISQNKAAPTDPANFYYKQ